MCDPELEYISAGMHDAIINELGNINSLLVKSKTATQQYLDSKLSGQQIGSELGANVIVKHSVVCTGEGMQLLIQLIQLIPEEKEIWSHTYDLDLSNSLTMYRDITKQIAKNIRTDITPQEKTYLNTAHL
jgi:TolB-like protein